MAETLLQDLPPHRGLMIILSSPSGAGKSTMAQRLGAWDGSLRFSVSATTRRPRAGEVDGRDYHFQDLESFRDLVARGEMLEHAEVFGNLYGSPRAPVVAALEAGHDVLFDIDWQGGQQIRNTARGEDVISIFLLPPSIAELERRLIARGKDNHEVIASRMRRARDEISHWAEYDYVLVNRDADATEAQLRAIVVAERLKRLRRPDLNGHVMALNAEFEDRSDTLRS